jgi:hypothetical protein
MNTLHGGSFGRLSQVEGDEDASLNLLIGYEQNADARLKGESRVSKNIASMQSEIYYRVY